MSKLLTVVLAVILTVVAASPGASGPPAPKRAATAGLGHDGQPGRNAHR